MNFMLLVARAISHSFAALTREILFLPLEHKIRIFSPPCNILYKIINAKCNNFPTQNVITFLTQNVITFLTQNVITFLTQNVITVLKQNVISQIVITPELQVCST